MITLAPLFIDDLDLSTIEQPQPAVEVAPARESYARPEDALGRTNILLVGRDAAGLAQVLRERAITERLNVISTAAAASRLLDSRDGRRGVGFIPSVLVAHLTSREVERKRDLHEVERVAAFGPRVALTVVLAVDNLSEVEGWELRSFEVFDVRSLAVAA